jgi:hypothetical protein
LDNYIILLDSVLLLKNPIREALEMARDDAVAFFRKSPQTTEITNHLGAYFLEQVEDVISAAGVNSTVESIVNSLWDISFDEPGTDFGALIAVHYLKSSKTAMAALANAAGGRNPRITNDADAPGIDKGDAVRLSQAEKNAQRKLKNLGAKRNGAKPIAAADRSRILGLCPFWCSTSDCVASRRKSGTACDSSCHVFPTTRSDRTSCLRIMKRFKLTALPDFPTEDSL